MNIEERLAIIDQLAIKNTIHYLCKRGLLNEKTKFRIDTISSPPIVRIYSSFEPEKEKTIIESFNTHGLPATIKFELATFQEYIDLVIKDVDTNEALQVVINSTKFKDLIILIRNNFKIQDINLLDEEFEETIAQNTTYPFDGLESIISKRNSSEANHFNFELLEKLINKNFPQNIEFITKLLNDKLIEIPQSLFDYTRYYALLGIKTNLFMSPNTLNSKPIFEHKKDNGVGYIELRVYKNTDLNGIDKLLKKELKSLDSFIHKPELNKYRKGHNYQLLLQQDIPEDEILDYLKTQKIPTSVEHKSRDIKRFTDNYFKN